MMSNNLRKKLSAYESEPPERVWDAISAGLEHPGTESYRKRLFDFQAQPPDGLWLKIQSHIGRLRKADPNVVPLFKKYRMPLKYSGIAAVIIVFGIISSLLISKKTVSEVPSGQAIHQAQPATPSLNVPENLPLNKHTSAISGISMRPGILQERIARQLHTAPTNTLALLEHVAPKYAQRKQAIDFRIPSDAYMIYTDGEGTVVRLPKKLFDAYACPYDKVSCRQHLKKLQEKIASSSLTSDLTGMLEMLNNLQEKQ